MTGARRVGVLGGMGVDPPTRLSGASRRVLAYLAVRGPRSTRALVCGSLWPNALEEHARANLRRGLWRAPAGWVECVGPDLVLLADTDLGDAMLAAGAALRGEVLSAEQLALLTNDLLPGWYEEWLFADQDQFHLHRVQALEQACRSATAAGAHWVAASAGLAAVWAEPLRESAVAALIEAHLAEGNRFEAVRRFRTYQTMLRRELDTEPGNAVTSLVASLVNVRGSA